MTNPDTQEIKREKWGHFFDRLSKDYSGKPAILEAYGPGTASHREVQTLPLVGITYESKSDSIEIILGTEPEDHISHTINGPEHVWLQREPGTEIIDIRGADGLTFLLRFSTLD